MREKPQHDSHVWLWVNQIGFESDSARSDARPDELKGRF